MKKSIQILIGLVCSVSLAYSQQQDTSRASAWEFSAEANFYFFSDDFIFLPVFKADKDHLHLEARYNYEDENTVSAWAGYNFSGGQNLEYVITPMLGVAAGRTNGIAPGLEFTIGYKGFELYSEAEYLFDFESSDNNYFYSWTDLSYSPADWLWFGISGQRTRVYDSDLEIERGLLVGTGYKNWELTGYLYNIGSDDAFVLLSLSASF